MDRNKIIELEKYIFGVVEKPGVAAGMVADIVGVLIDLKPAMIGSLSEDKRFEEMMDKLNLERVYFEHDSMKCFCASKKIKIAEKTRMAFAKLWSTMNDEGEILDRKKWVKATKRIGKLLGYPKTAVNEYVNETDLESEERMKRMERNRYYAHSAKFEEGEFNSYDRKLNKAISELAPKTAEFLSSNKEKRWLE
ncbi:hypothetical protein IKW73_01745 [Candidatus Saccharibacteria bacterium]|nr:hypothetical protein [Candidatus Saccharibacteria bacterium]